MKSFVHNKTRKGQRSLVVVGKCTTMSNPYSSTSTIGSQEQQQQQQHQDILKVPNHKNWVNSFTRLLKACTGGGGGGGGAGSSSSTKNTPSSTSTKNRSTHLASKRQIKKQQQQQQQPPQQQQDQNKITTKEEDVSTTLIMKNNTMHNSTSNKIDNNNTDEDRDDKVSNTEDTEQQLVAVTTTEVKDQVLDNNNNNNKNNNTVNDTVPEKQLEHVQSSNNRNNDRSQQHQQQQYLATTTTITTSSRMNPSFTTEVVVVAPTTNKKQQQQLPVLTNKNRAQSMSSSKPPLRSSSTSNQSYRFQQQQQQQHGSFSELQRTASNGNGNRNNKPTIVKRAVTENTNGSLHRRQQAQNHFDFDVASLHQITSTNCREGEEEEVQVVKNEFQLELITLPTTIDVTMRNISAVTDFSEEDGADVDELEAYNHYYVDDSDDNNNNNNGSNSKISSPCASSPTSVVGTIDTTTTCEQPSNITIAGTAGAPSWMLEWATAGPSTSEIGTTTTTTTTTIISPMKHVNADGAFQTLDCASSSCTSLEYSCSRDSNSDSVVQKNENHGGYLLSSPIPSMANSLASSSNNSKSTSTSLFFCGWVAANFENTSDWVYNDNAQVTEQSLYYLQIMLPSLSDSDESKLFFHLSRNGGEEMKTIIMSVSTCRVSVQHVSSRMGNCLVVQDDGGGVQLIILPVYVPKSIFKKKRTKTIQESDNSNKKNDCTCQLFFIPFRKDYTPNRNDDDDSNNNERLYAPDGQNDAVLHLRFAIDAALQTADNHHRNRNKSSSSRFPLQV